MDATLLEPRKALNKAFLKIKPNRSHIEDFKTNLIKIIDAINEKESEEFHKNLVIDFLKKTYYDPNYSVNTKGRNDLVIHNGKDAKTNVGVIIEAKSPVNKTEMITVTNLNGKALQELVLYYMRERIIHKNTELKHLVVTNIYEWFVFDAQLFNKLFAENKSFAKQFVDFEEGRLSGKTTDFFYKEIAKPFIESLQNTIEFAHFDIRNYEKPLRNTDKEDDKQLVALYKLLSPEHLLKLSFANDSNSLDKNFYSELLHIIGLTEVKDGGKKLIERHKQGNRNLGSLLENTIIQLDSLDKISRLQNAKQYGETYDEKVFNVALELTITWVNRILFLKLLEAQLISYHKGDKSYSFLNSNLIKDYDNLNSLFFQVLAKKPSERNERVIIDFAKVPYLNSSLFEPTDLEHETLFISGLEDNIPLPLLTATVIKDNQGKKNTGNKNALDYFFSFLDAYDFASEGSEDIQEDNKTLINASVLGLIFEKINGYKDGSFFTPSFITMYMCKETIRRAVLQKFNETKNWDCNDFETLYDKIEDRKEANAIINNIKICDPAVGSGHFLVSALNEIIAIKNDLRVLQDNKGNRLKEYHFEVVNDELIVTDEDGIPFQYNPKNKESQRIQETLFHEKQTIIENCLFGVDINPNSVKICRLRLWIELLKNAYYRSNTNELETLPNIDINIKCGNSLISRFALDADLKEALKKNKLSISDYKNAVKTYQNADSKEQKREMEEIILSIKQNFSTEIRLNDPLKKRLEKLAAELYHRFTGTFLFEPETPYGKSEKALEKQRKIEKEKLEKEIEQIQNKFEETKSNKIYENAFEWRFEFPDVLNDEGDFVGFDVVIGNPPYVQLQSMKEMSKQYEKLNFSTYTSMGDLYALFYEKGNQVLRNQGILCFITGSAWMRANYGKPLRDYLNTKTTITDLIDFSDCEIFDSATVLTNILISKKSDSKKPIKAIRFTRKDQDRLPLLKEIFDKEFVEIDKFPETSWIISDKSSFDIKTKVEAQGTKLIDWNIKISYGIKTGLNEAFIIDGKTKNELIAKDPKSAEIIKPLLRGRDVKKFYYDYQDLWIIGTFPSKKIDIEGYQGIKEYLLTFGKSLEQTGEKGSRKKTSGKWFEIQDSISYWEDFEKPKIIYPNMTKFLPFTFDNKQLYTNQKCFLITGNELEYLVSFLNSKLFKFCFEENFPELQGNTRELNKVIFEQLPIKKIPSSEQQPFIDKVNEILFLKSQDPKANTQELEQEIDAMVYELYGLSQEEIAIVESLN